MEKANEMRIAKNPNFKKFFMRFLKEHGLYAFLTKRISNPEYYKTLPEIEDVYSGKHYESGWSALLKRVHSNYSLYESWYTIMTSRSALPFEPAEFDKYGEIYRKILNAYKRELKYFLNCNPRFKNKI